MPLTAPSLGNKKYVGDNKKSFDQSIWPNFGPN